MVATAIGAHGDRPGPLIEVLHHVQEHLGHIPADAVPPIAKALNLSRAEVQGVIGFYHDFRTAPGGATTIHLCRAEACQAMGVRELEAHAKSRLGINYHETTADGRFTLEPVYCLGNCACTPSIRVGDRIYARVTTERFDENPGQRGPFMTARMYVPRDTTALALGADEVADAIVLEAARSGIPFEMVRSGTRAAYHLEPMVEVEDEHGRRAYGPVRPEDVPGLFAANFPGPSGHPLALGDPEEIHWLKEQQRVTF